MAAEYYLNFPTTQIFWGDGSGSPVSSRIPSSGTNVYVDQPIPFPAGSWLYFKGDKGSTICPANRALILRSFSGTAHGMPFTPEIKTYARGYGTNRGSLFELAIPNSVSALQAGDVMSGTLEMVQVPESASAYRGADRGFLATLAGMSDLWVPVQNEARLNNLDLTVFSGHSATPAGRPAYPIYITAETSGTGTVLADFSFKSGFGLIPFTLFGVPKGWTCRLQRYNESTDAWTHDLSQQVHGNDFWQDYVNASRSRDLTFNLAPGAGRSRYRVIAIQRPPVPPPAAR